MKGLKQFFLNRIKISIYALLSPSSNSADPLLFCGAMCPGVCLYMP